MDISRCIYPNGMDDLKDITTEALLRRLINLRKLLQNSHPGRDKTIYAELSHHLCSEFLIEHHSSLVRVNIACCIADLFRIFTPEKIPEDEHTLKSIFHFFIGEMKGLKEPFNSSFHLYIYTFAMLSLMKVFNHCINLPGSQILILKLIDGFFNVVNDDNFARIDAIPKETISTIISTSPMISSLILDKILYHVVNPKRNELTFTIAKYVLKASQQALEPHVTHFFLNAIVLEQSESQLITEIYDLLYEVSRIYPNVFTTILPQLEYKMANSFEVERTDVTKLIGRVLSDVDSDLASKNQGVLYNFLSRIQDNSFLVRCQCLKYIKATIHNHPELEAEIRLHYNYCIESLNKDYDLK